LANEEMEVARTSTGSFRLVKNKLNSNLAIVPIKIGLYRCPKTLKKQAVMESRSS